tara:strand:- start:3029 stop:3154 length:126 start_codon:yes stop_codon:yes gene_type:complete
MKELIDQIRKEISCCCSEHRYIAINKLLDEMEKELNNGKII